MSGVYMQTQEKLEQDGEYRPKWENRRRVLFLFLGFCAAMVIAVFVDGRDTGLNQDIARFAFIMGGLTIGSYVFGATWESIGLKK